MTIEAGARSVSHHEDGTYWDSPVAVFGAVGCFSQRRPIRFPNPAPAYRPGFFPAPRPT